MLAALNLQQEEILREKVRQYLVLFDKHLKGCKEKDVVTNTLNAMGSKIEFVENGKSIQGMVHI